MTYKILYIKSDLSLWVAMDHVDWEWAHHFMWNYKPRESGLSSHWYAKRNVGRERTPVYLHVEIMRRKMAMPKGMPITDHINGNTLDCRRNNLRWTTPKINANNRWHKSYCLPILREEIECPF